MSENPSETQQTDVIAAAVAEAVETINQAAIVEELTETVENQQQQVEMLKLESTWNDESRQRQWQEIQTISETQETLKANLQTLADNQALMIAEIARITGLMQASTAVSNPAAGEKEVDQPKQEPEPPAPTPPITQERRKTKKGKIWF